MPITMLRYRVFGGISAWTPDGWRPIATAKQRSLLAVLLTRPNITVPAETLVEQVWPDRAPRTSRNVLQGYVSALRRLIWTDDHGAPLAWIDSGYRLTVGPGESEIDVFDTTRAAAGSALADGDLHRARTLFGVALKMTRGPVFGDAGNGTLVEAEVHRLTEARHGALLGRLQADLGLGCHLDVLAEVQPLLAERPFDETLHFIYAAALYEAGRAADALAHCRDVRRRLAEELGIDPGRRLVQLEGAVLRREPLSADRPRVTSSPVRVVRPGIRPAQLPPGYPDFVAREKECAQIKEVLGGEPAGTFPAVVMITGDPGIGKSALATHAGHALAGRFQDGQLYLDLGTGDAAPLDPVEALAQLLVSVGVERGALPHTLSERSALLRTCLAGRRMLLVLDNACYESQVRPLIPNESGCGVLVTGRTSLAGISTVTPIELSELTTPEAVRLLANIVGHDRVGAEQQAAIRVAELCGGMPLAVRIAGTRLANRRHRLVSWLAERLEDEHRRLDELVVSDRSLRGALETCYRTLEPELSSAMRALSLLEVPDFAPWLAAAALACDPQRAEDVIEGLVEARLLGLAPSSTSERPRFRFHRLVQLYGRELAAGSESDADRREVLARAYSACLTWADQVGETVCPKRRTVVSSLPRPAIAVRQARDTGECLAWFGSERETLAAAVRHSAAACQHDLAWDLALALEPLFSASACDDDWLEIADIALAAARHSGDRAAQSGVLTGIGRAHARCARYAEAAEYYSHAAIVLRSR